MASPFNPQTLGRDFPQFKARVFFQGHQPGPEMAHVFLRNPECAAFFAQSMRAALGPALLHTDCLRLTEAQQRAAGPEYLYRFNTGV